MAEPSFEFRLERMFAEAPAMADGELFALRVADKLDRGWSARRLLIGVMGAAGGFVGAVQLLGAGGLVQTADLGGRADAFLHGHLVAQLSSLLAPAGLTIDMQALWMAATLALVAAGFGLARLVRDI